MLSLYVYVLVAGNRGPGHSAIGVLIYFFVINAGFLSLQKDDFVRDYFHFAPIWASEITTAGWLQCCLASTYELTLSLLLHSACDAA